ncbi:MAG: MAPEG family protein [Hyphomicrobiales bacterium]|nr:MAPEG family protein [Hyphomicrobiales bacterium]
MAVELHYLVWTVALAFAQMLIAVSGATLEVGLPELAGNREPAPKITGWADRARRSHLNMLESLVLFAALVLTAVVAQKTNSTTALGAEIFFWARLVYAIIYAAGIPWLRTAVWGVSVIGLVMIFTQVV